MNKEFGDVEVMAFSEIKTLLLLNGDTVFDFTICLENIFNEIAEVDSNEQFGITKLQLFNLLKIPFFISEKIFSAFNHSKKSLESLNEEDFLHSFTKLYYGTFEETAEVIFDIFDFDRDGLINAADIKLLLSYLPVKEDRVQHVNTFQFKMLEAIDAILDVYFEKEDSINLEKFKTGIQKESYLFLQMLCYLFKRIPLVTQNLNFEEVKNDLKSVSESIYSNNKNTKSHTVSLDLGLSTLSDTFSSNNDSQQPFLLKEKQSSSNKVNKSQHDIYLKVPTHNSNLINNALKPNKRSSISHTFNPLRKIISNSSIDAKNTFDSPQISGYKGMIRVPKIVYSKYTKNLEESLKKYELEEKDKVIKEIIESPHKHPIEKDDFDELIIHTNSSDTQECLDHSRKKGKTIQTKNTHLNLKPLSVVSLLKKPYRKEIRSHSVGAYNSKEKENFKQRKANTLKNLILLKDPNKYNQETYYEGTILTLPSEKQSTKKEFWVKIIGKNLFYYEKEDREKAVFMHSLVNCFVNESELFSYDNCFYYCVSIDFPNKKIEFYFYQEEESYNFLFGLKKAIGYENFFDYYEMIDSIGEGSTSEVKLGKNHKTNEKVAIKIIRKEEISSEGLESVRNEIDILKFINHPNIIRFFDYFENSEYIFIVFEYISIGNLESFMESTALNETIVAKITYQIADAISYLNRFGIIHRDIKLENVMVVQANPDIRVKVIDFGFSKVLAPKEKLSDGLGTLVYVAPEIILRDPYDKPIDIWSLGVCIYYLIYEKFPFDDISDDEETIAMKIINDPLKFDETQEVSKELILLLKKCLKKDPEKRIKAESILKHKWVVDNMKSKDL